MISRIMMCGIVGLLALSLTTAYAENQPPNADFLKIDKVSLDKKSFNPAAGGEVKINFELSKPAKTSVVIYDSDDSLVRRLVSNKDLEAGSHSVVWDGRDEKKDIVPEDAYVYTIMADDGTGRHEVYDPSDDTKGVTLDTRNMKFDEDSGVISYLLPKAARVRIRIGLEDILLLDTLLDWELREAGEYTERWDFKDKNGLFNLKGYPKLSMRLLAYSLADNSIIVKSGIKKESAVIAGREGVRRQKNPLASPMEDINFHSLHKRADCHEPEFKIEFLESKMSNGGAPVVKGATPVRVTISDRDKWYLTDTRYEVMFFVDAVFIYEEEEGISPFTYYWDTKGLSRGEHILTVNIMNYDDHIGVESRKVIVE